jgi:rhamnogalacturonan endolyase
MIGDCVNDSFQLERAMKTLSSVGLCGRFVCAFVAVAMILSAPLVRAADLPPVAKPAVSTPVTITDNGTTWTMDNGIVKATILKNNGNMQTIMYHGVSIVGRSEYWEQTPSGQITASITIDPAKNGGERGEVAVKGAGTGRIDIEVRYVLERGVSGFYTYAQYTHPATNGAGSFGENRFILQMNPTFNWLSVDKDRNQLMIANEDQRSGTMIHAKEQSIIAAGNYKNSVEHKYTYCGIMYRLPAYGWSSTKDHIGIYFINPTTEYIGGGAEKMDLVCHMGATLLDYWTSGHYAGGAGCNVPAGENWKKVVGPIFVYMNALQSPKDPTPAELATLAATQGNPTIPATWHDNAFALWNDALDKAKEVEAAWPFEWVSGVDYPHKNERGNVTGQFVLNDPQAASTKLPNLTVGLAHPDYTSGAGGFVARAGNGNTITWQHDGNYYEFWNNGTEDGKFTITNVRPGTYTLHAFADGVLGEYAKTNITVEAGKNLDMGKVEWTPVRNGKQVWEIGYPNRNGSEFFKGDQYWLWGWCLRYALLFPNDITYTIGKSDYHKDWFFEQTPHATNLNFVNPAAKDPANQAFGWVNLPSPAGANMWGAWGRGRATTWTVKFNMDKAVQGTATLRVSLGGSDSTTLSIGMNGKPAGQIRPISTNALRYNTDRGVWREYSQPFDASLMKAGENSMTLTVPAGDCTSGVCYDYLRLELQEK